MKYALVLLMCLSLSAVAAEKKAAAKAPAKPAAKTAPKRGPASSAAATPAPAAPQASSKRKPDGLGVFKFEERVVGDKTVVCGWVDSQNGAGVSCTVVGSVAR